MTLPVQEHQLQSSHESACQPVAEASYPAVQRRLDWEYQVQTSAQSLACWGANDLQCNYSPCSLSYYYYYYYYYNYYYAKAAEQRTKKHTYRTQKRKQQNLYNHLHKITTKMVQKYYTIMMMTVTIFGWNHAMKLWVWVTKMIETVSVMPNKTDRNELFHYSTTATN